MPITAIYLPFSSISSEALMPITVIYLRFSSMYVSFTMSTNACGITFLRLTCNYSCHQNSFETYEDLCFNINICFCFFFVLNRR